MKKVFLIGWKDVTLAFRDRAALILMLAAPFLLTLGLGFVTGRFSGAASNGVGNIPVVIVNQDDGQLGAALVSLFQSKDLAQLVAPTLLADPAEARRQVDADQAAAAIIVPPGFSGYVFPPVHSMHTDVRATIEIYANPTRPTGVGVIKTIVKEFSGRVKIESIRGQVILDQMLSHGLIHLQEVFKVGIEMGERQQNRASITLKNVTGGGRAVDFDTLAFMAPGMALMFLMYTVSSGGRTLLTEQNLGTLPRLLVTPISTAQVLGGKVFGIFLTGAAQMFILIAASALLFQLHWGDPLGVILLVLAAVAAATGWGMLITAVARTPGQVSAIGSAVMLTFGILGGTFINLSGMPGWFQVFSKITPNAWGLDGFTTLAMGGQLSDIMGPVAALLVMGALLFSAAVILIKRRGFAQR